MGLLANAGFPHPLVHPRPRVIVISTGDELIPPTESPEFGQVRDSNAYMIFSALRDVGAQPVLAGIVKDDVDALKETVLSYLIQADAFVSSGGVSVGERDVVKAAFFRRGAREAERRARYAEGVAHGVAHRAQSATEKVTGGAERSYDDATLRAKVESEIFRAPDAPKDRVSVNTANGIVYLRGQLERQEEIESLVAAARRVEGVQDVRNLLHQPGAPAPGA